MCALAGLSIDAPSLSGDPAIARTAGYITSQGDPLLVWLHRPRRGLQLDHGVLICSPIGHEQLYSHRTLRHLADALARRGMPTVRFDWHGTGDSAGSDDDPRRLATWQANVADMLHWMRGELHCRSIDVIGARTGALIAVEALRAEAIENLVLFDPVSNGRSYVREMTMLDRAGAASDAGAADVTGAIEAGGCVLTKELATELSALRLEASSPQCRRVLVVQREETRANDRWANRCTDLGIAFESIVVPDMGAMLAEPHLGQVPQAAIERIAHWLTENMPAAALVEPHATPIRENAEIRVQGGAIRERAWRLNVEPDLFGVVSEPQVIDAGLPTVVLLNAGATHHVGPGRLYVQLARRLAQAGFRCLRLDVCGLGDSVTTEPASENDSYAATALRDVAIAVERLRSEYGADRQVLMGLCSGAYAAFQAAAQIDAPDLVESVLINPLTFFWKDGMQIDADPARNLRDHDRWMKAARQPSKWLKFLAGRTTFRWRDAWRVLHERRRLRKPRRTNANAPAPYPTHPANDDLAGDLGRIVDRKRTLAMFFAKNDPGYTILTFYAARQAKKMTRTGALHVEFIDGADHTFSRRQPRAELIERLRAYLTQRFATD